MNRPLDRLRHHVTGAIERGEAEAIVEVAPQGHIQAAILDALEDRESILVHGGYIGDVLALQSRGLVTSGRVEGGGQLVVRLRREECEG
jgi:hypothetical protein